MKRHHGVAGGMCALLAWASVLHGEVIDSGYVENTGDEPAVIFSTNGYVSGANSVYLSFDTVQLSGNEAAGTGSYLRLTSVSDSAVQTMHATHVAQWLNKSAYFNGDAVQIEMIAYPGTGLNRIVFEPKPAAGGAPGSSPCKDRRALSDDPRTGRTLGPNGGGHCTAFIIDDACHCLLTVRHCAGGLYVVEFNVPLSNGAGRVAHPPPSDQYAVDRSSRRPQPGDEVAGDWCYFGCFPNSTTGLTPFEAQGAYYSLASVPGPAEGQTMRVTGYGQTSPPVSNTWNRVQKTLTGTYELYSDFDPDAPQIVTDVSVSLGNSGSAALNVDACEVIGIIGSGGCGISSGSAIDTPDLQAALADPWGVCIPDCNTNGVPDADDIAEGTSEDCSSNGIPDECEPDCNTNGVADSCDILAATSQDCGSNGVPDECEPDCNSNGAPDSCDIFEGTSDDCNCTRISDECEIAAGTSEDCNSNGVPDECEEDCNYNGIPDECDVAAGTSLDCNTNGTPDECEEDCNENGVPDDCDISAGTSEDCTDNGVPDECEPDCNTNGVADSCDVLEGTSEDCNTNGVPDECDPDCNANGFPDECDIAAGTSQDCNSNGWPDECDMATGRSLDCNSNGVPDECDIAGGTSPDCNTNGVPDECDVDCNTNGIPDDCDISAGTSQDCNSNGTADECDVAGFGDLFVGRSRAATGRVEQFDSASGIFVKEFIPLFGGGLLQPLGMTFHPNGSLLVADETPHTVRQYDGVTGDYLGDFVAAEAGGLYSPWDITFGPSGNLFVANVCTNGASTNGILEYDGETGAPVGTFATDELEAPYGLTFGPNDNLFVCDYQTAEIVEFNGTNGSLVGVFASTNGTDLDGPSALAFDPTGGKLFVADAATNGIVEFDGTNGVLVGVFIEDVGDYGAASLMDLAFGPDGHLYVSHKESRAVYKYDESTGELLATLPSSSPSPVKPLRLAFRPPLADCNTNGVPDSCDLDAGTSSDCNTNGTPDECDLMDCDTNGVVDLADFAGFQSCLASTNGTCLAAFDRAADCGTIDLADYAVFAAQLTGPSSGGESMMMMGGGGGGDGEGGGGGAGAAPEGDGEAGAAEDGEDETPPPPPEEEYEEEYDPWTYVEADVSLEVRPVGGGDPLTVLAPDTTYELHYQAGYDRVNAYVVFAVATSADQGFADAAPPAAGDWSTARDFQFVDIEAELGGLVPAHGYPEGYFRYQMAYDDFWLDTEGYAGSQGHLCTFTTQSPGELNLQLYMCWLDNDQFEDAEMYTQAQYVVEDPGADDQ